MTFENPLKEENKTESQEVKLKQQGLTFNQIAEQLNKSVSAVKMKYYRDVEESQNSHNSHNKVTYEAQKVTQKSQNSHNLVTSDIKSEVKKQLKEEVYKEIEEAKKQVVSDLREELDAFKEEIQREIKKTQGQNAFIKNMLREYLGDEKYEEIKNKILENSED